MQGLRQSSIGAVVCYSWMRVRLHSLYAHNVYVQCPTESHRDALVCVYNWGLHVHNVWKWRSERPFHYNLPRCKIARALGETIRWKYNVCRWVKQKDSWEL